MHGCCRAWLATCSTCEEQLARIKASKDARKRGATEPPELMIGAPMVGAPMMGTSQPQSSNSNGSKRAKASDSVPAGNHATPCHAM